MRLANPLGGSCTGPNTCTHNQASLSLIEWEKLSSPFAGLYRHGSCASRIAAEPERTCLQAKGRQIDPWYLPVSSIHSHQFSCLCVEHWETGAGFRVALVMCDDGAELSGPDSHQIHPDYARLHDEYFTEINHGWAWAPFCWFHWEGREAGKPGWVLTGCLQPQGKWRQ